MNYTAKQTIFLLVGGEVTGRLSNINKKLSYNRETARRTVSKFVLCFTRCRDQNGFVSLPKTTSQATVICEHMVMFLDLETFW